MPRRPQNNKMQQAKLGQANGASPLILVLYGPQARDGARGIGDLRGWWFVGAVLAGFGVGSLVYTLRVRPMLPLAVPWWGAALFLVSWLASPAQTSRPHSG